MNEIKPIQTYYDGHLFRSRLEARWAVVFNALHVPYEYEPEGFDLGDGLYYLPDFRVKCYGCRGNYKRQQPFDLYIEVKGKMTAADAIKIKRFTNWRDEHGLRSYPLLIVDKIPDEGNATGWILYQNPVGFELTPFNYETIDGDWFGAYPAATKDGKFYLFGADSNYINDDDAARMERAYRLARCARFEHGERPPV